MPVGLFLFKGNLEPLTTLVEHYDLESSEADLGGGDGGLVKG